MVLNLHAGFAMDHADFFATPYGQGRWASNQSSLPGMWF
jgi:hypothetical protein